MPPWLVIVVLVIFYVILGCVLESIAMMLIFPGLALRLPRAIY